MGSGEVDEAAQGGEPACEGGQTDNCIFLPGLEGGGDTTPR